MPAIAAARSLQHGWEVQLTACLHERFGILVPTALVEIRRQKKARLVQQHGIDPHYEIATRVIAAGQMPSNYIIGYRRKVAMGTLRTFGCAFVTQASHPFIVAGGLVAGLTGSAALETPRINIIAPPEKRAKQGDLLFWLGTVSNGIVVISHTDLHGYKPHVVLFHAFSV